MRPYATELQLRVLLYEQKNDKTNRSSESILSMEISEGDYDCDTPLGKCVIRLRLAGLGEGWIR